MGKTYNVQLSQVKDFAKKIAKGLTGGEVLGLVGPLGSGKTTFTKALAKELGIKKTVASPTFVLMNIFRGSLPKGKTKQLWLYHLDLYRCKNFKEVEGLGVTEFWGKPNTLTIIEWADVIAKHLPKKTTFIKFQATK